MNNTNLKIPVSMNEIDEILSLILMWSVWFSVEDYSGWEIFSNQGHHVIFYQKLFRCLQLF